jgi:hypothetical protein
MENFKSLEEWKSVLGTGYKRNKYFVEINFKQSFISDLAKINLDNSNYQDENLDSNDNTKSTKELRKLKRQKRRDARINRQQIEEDYTNFIKDKYGVTDRQARRIKRQNRRENASKTIYSSYLNTDGAEKFLIKGNDGEVQKLILFCKTFQFPGMTLEETEEVVKFKKFIKDKTHGDLTIGILNDMFGFSYDFWRQYFREVVKKDYLMYPNDYMFDIELYSLDGIPFSKSTNRGSKFNNAINNVKKSTNRVSNLIGSGDAFTTIGDPYELKLSDDELVIKKFTFKNCYPMSLPDLDYGYENTEIHEFELNFHWEDFAEQQLPGSLLNAKIKGMPDNLDNEKTFGEKAAELLRSNLQEGFQTLPDNTEGGPTFTSSNTRSAFISKAREALFGS